MPQDTTTPRNDKTYLCDFNRTGHLGRDPEYKVVPRDGREPLRIAHTTVHFANYRRSETRGEWEEVGSFWADVDLYGERAVEYARCLRKGMRVRVEGSLHHQLYQGEKGLTTAFSINAGSIAIVPTQRLETRLAPRQEEGEASAPEEAGKAEEAGK
ncbi:single-stranded DNA-binding protein [Endothiovibrio diazotrophicus]